MKPEDERDFLASLLSNLVERIWKDAPPELQANLAFQEHVRQIIREVQAQCRSLREESEVDTFGRAGDDQ